MTFDFRSDTPPGRDPDSHSPTLRTCHRLLWSKPLPGGGMFSLSETRRNCYLHHRSELGEFFLSSDRIAQGLAGWGGRLQAFAANFSEAENEDYRALANSVTGVIVWPGNQIGRKQTINAARGLNSRIADRIDLTLEAVRRHYAGERSPLSETLGRYADFFDLFESFQGYVEFFHLQDLVATDTSQVRFFVPFDDFHSSGVPVTVESYADFRRHHTDFLMARRQRIATWQKGHLVTAPT
ncbi:DUF6994 family protein [Nesterenkonia sp. DZ6]|uniref:DUF6994 family protein n=1 Tax=Nesterenkonia sp. DZ6 TaxID=2901229 RepID=UPI001F4D313E|nr:hypothetical protein [Nesterenkonia sp. DZ6]